MRDLIDRKWVCFAGALYNERILTFAVMTLSVFGVFRMMTSRCRARARHCVLLSGCSVTA